MFITLTLETSWTKEPYSHCSVFPALPNDVPLFIPCLPLWGHFASGLGHLYPFKMDDCFCPLSFYTYFLTFWLCLLSVNLWQIIISLASYREQESLWKLGWSENIWKKNHLASLQNVDNMARSSGESVHPAHLIYSKSSGVFLTAATVIWRMVVTLWLKCWVVNSLPYLHATHVLWFP